MVYICDIRRDDLRNNKLSQHRRCSQASLHLRAIAAREFSTQDGRRQGVRQKMVSGLQLDSIRGTLALQCVCEEQGLLVAASPRYPLPSSFSPKPAASASSCRCSAARFRGAVLSPSVLADGNLDNLSHADRCHRSQICRYAKL